MSVRVRHHTILTKKGEGRVAEVILNRPDKRNALTPEMLERFHAALLDVERSGDAGAIVVRGEGGVFCAGFDLAMVVDDADALDRMLIGLAGVMRTIRRSCLPVIAAVEKAAIAGGCALATASDLVVADAHAKLGYPVVTLGISPAVSAPTLARRIGAARTRELMYAASLVDGRRAREIGVVDRCVDLAEDVVPRAQLEAAALAAKPRDAVGATKRWLLEIEGLDDDDEWDRALEVSRSIVGAEEQVARVSRVVARMDS